MQSCINEWRMAKRKLCCSSKNYARRRYLQGGGEISTNCQIVVVNSAVGTKSNRNYILKIALFGNIFWRLKPQMMYLSKYHHFLVRKCVIWGQFRLDCAVPKILNVNRRNFNDLRAETWFRKFLDQHLDFNTGDFVSSSIEAHGSSASRCYICTEAFIYGASNGILWLSQEGTTL